MASCNAIAVVVVIVVAVVVGYMTGNWALAKDMSYAAAGFIAGASASIASQTVGMAVGTHDNISWSDAFASGVGGAVTYGMAGGMSATADGATSIGDVYKGLGTAQKALIAGAGVAASAGAQKLVGKPSGFQWRNVAAAAGTSALGDALGLSDPDSMLSRGIDNGFAFDMVSGVARSGISYGIRKGLGDDKASWNFRDVAVDSFGNALGNQVVNRMKQAEMDRQYENRQALGLEGSPYQQSQGGGFDVEGAYAATQAEQQRQNRIAMGLEGQPGQSAGPGFDPVVAAQMAKQQGGSGPGPRGSLLGLWASIGAGAGLNDSIYMAQNGWQSARVRADQAVDRLSIAPSGGNGTYGNGYPPVQIVHPASTYTGPLNLLDYGGIALDNFVAGMQSAFADTGGYFGREFYKGVHEGVYATDAGKAGKKFGTVLGDEVFDLTAGDYRDSRSYAVAQDMAGFGAYMQENMSVNVAMGNLEQSAVAVGDFAGRMRTSADAYIGGTSAVQRTGDIAGGSGRFVANSAMMSVLPIAGRAKVLRREDGPDVNVEVAGPGAKWRLALSTEGTRFIDPAAFPKFADSSRKVQMTVKGQVVIRYGENAGQTANVILKREAGTTLTKKGYTRSRDANGFVVFESKFDTMVPDELLGNGKGTSHFKHANSRVRAMLQENPGLANDLGLDADQVHFFLNTNNGKAPPGLTWHHHQDVGRLQLINRAEHQAFVPHTGGMSIWGGGYE